ncbi:MAG: hypothetical protein JW940_05135 [Polyangiaceae bacterium]|nr:hypothetical protein [Polyangiaceae bacterium]
MAREWESDAAVQWRARATRARQRTSWHNTPLGRAVGVALVGVWSVGPGACNRHEADRPSERESVSSVSQAVEADSEVLLRQTAGGYEIEVRGELPLLPIGNHDPVLHVGAAVFKLYRNSPTVRERGAVFPVTPEQFAALTDGAPVSVALGPLAPGRLYGHLDKSAVQEAP